MNDLYLPPLRTPNSGSFRKGVIPWNKGRKGQCCRGRVREITTRGVQGFKCRPVLCLHPDGTIKARFPSVGAAAKAVGARDRHTITNACHGKYRCRGYKWYYEDEYVPYADYRYRLRTGRDAYGRLQKGNHLRIGARLSPEAAERRREQARQRSFLMAHDPNSNWGKSFTKLKPVRDVTTMTDYPSIKAAASALGVPQHYISGAISRNGITRGHKFIKI